MLPTVAQLHFDAEPVDDFDALVAKYDKGAFASPFRSTIPLLACLKDDMPCFQAMLAACGVAGQVTVHCEFKVDSPTGVGSASQTDAMVLSETMAVAIEAKWTEPRYESVAKRLKRLPPKSQRPTGFDEKSYLTSQRALVDGWLDLLRPVAASRLSLNDVDGVVYQMVHRAASARGSLRSPRLVYLHFVPALGSLAASAATTDQYLADLTHLHGVLGHPKEFPFYLAEVVIRPTSSFAKIQELPKRGPITDAEVRAALLDGRLFEFHAPTIAGIGGGSGWI